MSQVEAEARERAALHAKQDIADAAALRRGHDQKVSSTMTVLLPPVHVAPDLARGLARAAVWLGSTHMGCSAPQTL